MSKPAGLDPDVLRCSENTSPNPSPSFGEEGFGCDADGLLPSAQGVMTQVTAAVASSLKAAPW